MRTWVLLLFLFVVSSELHAQLALYLVVVVALRAACMQACSNHSYSAMNGLS
jgi:hypothetical protein